MGYEITDLTLRHLASGQGVNQIPTKSVGATFTCGEPVESMTPEKYKRRGEWRVEVRGTLKSPIRRDMRDWLRLFFLLLVTGYWSLVTDLCAEEKKDGPTWFRPQISVYTPPPPEISTSPVFRTVDPQIIQKLIELLDEASLSTKVSQTPSSSLDEVKSFRTPGGLELSTRYEHLGIVLAESLGWEPIKHVRVISEQNLKQRLTTVARWDHTPIVRSIALFSLAVLKDKNDIVYFKEALWSRNVGIRFATIEALQKWGFSEAIPLLQDLVNKDESFFIRIMASAALAKMNDSFGFEKLRKGLEDKDWLIRALSAKTLGEIGNHEDYDLLISQLSREQILGTSSNEFVVSEIAIAALKLFPKKIEWEKQEREKKKKKSTPAPTPPSAQPTVKALPKQNILFELEPIVVTAPRLKIPQGELADPQINFQLLKMVQQKDDLRLTDDQANQSISYKDLNSLETPDGVRLKSRYTELGYLLTEGLAGVKDFQLVDELVRIAREGKNPNVKSYALVALSYCKDRSHLGLFQDALRSSTNADRFAAVEALQIWGYPEAISILIGVSKMDTSPIVRIYAAQAVFRLRDLMGKDYLLRSLDDQDWVVRAMAMRYLGEMGTGEDYNKLLSYLTSQQTNIVRAEMCSALLRLYAKKFEEENK